MWCPSCRGEYRAGISECPQCRVALVDERPAAPASRVRLLRPATAVAMVAISAHFAVRAAATLVVRPGTELLAAAAAVALAAHLAMAFFVLAYAAERAPRPGVGLRVAAWALLVLLAAAAVVDAANLAAVLDRPFGSPPVIRAAVPVLSLVVPAAALLFLAAVQRAERPLPVRRAATVAVAAAALSLAVHLVGAVRLALLAPVAEGRGPSAALAVPGLLVAVLVWAGIMVFLAALRRDLHVPAAAAVR